MIKIMSKQKEEEKERISADEDQTVDISNEEVEPADKLISQTMPALYQAIVDHNIETV